MVDVTVRGAGIFGLSIAWECLRRGASVRVVDPYGVAAGASGGILGALAPHVPENWNPKKARQLESLLAAEQFWAEVAETSGLDSSYARTGRVQPLADDRAVGLAEARSKTAAELWQGQASWRVVDGGALLELMPEGLRPISPTGCYVYDTLSARIFPRQGCKALAQAITARGGEIVQEAADEGAVVWATGVADLDRMSARLGRSVGNAVKGQGALLEFDARQAPQVFSDGVHIVPHSNGTVAIGSTSERFFETPFETDNLLDEVLATAHAALPSLAKAKVLERWAGLRPKAKSRGPMLGVHPLKAGQFVANGGFKIGFGMAPDVAAMMAKLILDKTDTIPAQFRPEASL